MKPFDTIYSVNKNNPILPTKKPEKYWKYFYKSLEIVLSFWIVTVVAITTTPWLDYWIKSTIRKAASPQILGENVSLTPTTEENQQKTAIFHLKNPKVDINAPIVEGVDVEALKKGIGHHADSVWPNQKGNVVLAGHNFDLDAENPYNQVFISLRLVEVGDEVTIEYQGKTYRYQVIRRETLDPTDISLFSPQDDFILTFYTCDPPYTDWKRLVFQAKLEKIE